MTSRIKIIIKKIEDLNNLLNKEYPKLAEKYGFFINKNSVIFLNKIRKKNKSLRVPIWKYIIPKNIRHFLSMPFIYIMIIPIVILDLFITIYHLVAFPLYKIPKVKRSDYIVYDRRFLDYLNIIQKIHCLYCSYVVGFLAYSSEIAARTERYWCPIKAAKKPVFHHSWYKNFADYGSPEEWNEKFNDSKAFIEFENDETFKNTNLK